MKTSVVKREPRTIRPWFYRGPMGTPGEDVQHLITQFFGDGETWPVAEMAPTMDVSETDNAVEVRMDVPGVDPKDVDIQIRGNVLSVTGQRKEETTEKGKTWHRVERRFGSFARTMTLPAEVKEDAVQAAYRDGVLTVTLPKAEQVKARKIEVKT